MRQIKQCDHDRANVSEGRDLLCEFCKLYFERRIRLVLLHLLRHLAHHGLQTDFPDIEDTLPVKDHCPAEQGILVHKRVARDVVRQLYTRVCRRLLALLRLSVQRRVIHLERTVDQDTVRRNLVARLKQDLVADHDIIHLDHCHDSVPVYLTLVLLSAVLELAVLSIARHASLG